MVAIEALVIIERNREHACYAMRDLGRRAGKVAGDALRLAWVDVWRVG
jgi:hypothetical protein